MFLGVLFVYHEGKITLVDAQTGPPVCVCGSGLQCVSVFTKSEDPNENHQRRKKKKNPHLCVRWCETLAAVDSDQGVLLHRDVELEEAWLLQIQLGAPEHPRRDALAHSLADVHLPRVDGVVLLVEAAALPCGDGKHGRI